MHGARYNTRQDDWKDAAMVPPERLDRGDGVSLAFRRQVGRGPVVVFLPGLRSDMLGSKACAVAEFCAARGQAFLRLDYYGHGESDGRFEEGTIGRWFEDALHVVTTQTEGPLLLIGSSMGGWMALKLALALGTRVVGLIGIAAAPDFTERLMWASMAPPERHLIETEGRLEVPSPYGDPLVITRALIEDGRRQVVLDAPLPFAFPVRLLHGQRDADVPWELALTLAQTITGGDVQTMLIKDGDHRLSRPQDLALLERALSDLLGLEDGGKA
jgi:pimeloyl-ACP methyl ester carboxylesterase